jgi:DNA-binding IclR family transcriptional regulator
MKQRSKPRPRDIPFVVDAAAKPDTSVKSAFRVLQVLEFFDQVQRDARVSEIAERLHFPQSSTSVLLKCLSHAGYLEYTPSTRTYIPTARVALLGSWVSGSPVRDGSILRMMDELSSETGETIVLGCASGIYSKYIHVIQATNMKRLHIPAGNKRLLVWSAMGICLLRDEPDEQIHLLVRRTNMEAMPGQKAIDVRQTLAHVDQMRRRGYFFSRGLVTPGAGAICMRVPDNPATLDRPLVIGIAGLLESIERHEGKFVRLMRDVLDRYISLSSFEVKPRTRRQSSGTK